MKKLLIIITLMFIVVFTIGLVTGISITKNKPCINLPKEYKMIDESTAIIGYFDKDSILHIKFDNRMQFEWEGMESDIPEDGNRMLNLSTNENTVYLNPVDE